ncbi:unnamed protein product [Schistocephalus solidus]|uniref:Uncharacterized protein n=1 Tax=Schistocephalus solidus TaxID=70667 RepID=A0A183S9Y4_SCHSO|nr:unnamed protein product [Schistocephalus solidus]
MPDWFGENDADISNLLAEKNGLRKAYMDLRTDATKAAFFRCRRLVQQRLREMQDAWMIRMAEEIQGSDGTTLLTEKSQILKCWAKHFRSFLNCSSAISDAAIDRLPQVDMNSDLNLPPSQPETIRAMQQISSGKSPGADAIPPEINKNGGPRLMTERKTLFQEMWRQGQVPRDFKDANIVHLYKRKGNRKFCDNHRGISLLNIAGKIASCRRPYGIATNTEAEMVRQDPGHASPGADRDPQHPRHAEASATVMERPLVRMVDERLPKMTFLRRCRYVCSPTGRSKMTLQKQFEEIAEATANQPGDLGGPCSG